MNDSAIAIAATPAATLSCEGRPPLLEVRDLRTYFGQVKAVDGVSFTIQEGKTLGLVGESGCGKTTVGRTILRLTPASGGSVCYRGRNLFQVPGRELRRMRRAMQIIFQDPVSSLNPRMTIGNIIGEPIQVHGIARGAARNELVASLLARVGLDPSFAGRHPHEFSGGQRQRIGIARALALGPEFIVCDEPVSALDVSIQSQILNLLGELQKERKIAYLFIAHNLAVVEHFSDEVAVMYLGRIVEQAPASALYANPKAPPTPSRCCRPFPSPTPVRSGSALCSKAKCPRPPIPRPAAPSIHAVRSRVKPRRRPMRARRSRSSRPASDFACSGNASPRFRR